VRAPELDAAGAPRASCVSSMPASAMLRDLRKELAGLIADCDANTQDAKCPVIQRLPS
jgi:hypothetical protein